MQKICIQIFFIAAALLFMTFYFAVIFYIQDILVIFGILVVTVLIIMILSLANPKALGQFILKKGKYGRMAILGLPAIILVAAMKVCKKIICAFLIGICHNFFSQIRLTQVNWGM